MSKKVAFVTSDLPAPNVAGHLSYNDAIIRFLKGEGYSVDVIVLRPRPRRPVFKTSPAMAVHAADIAGRGLFCWGGWCVLTSPMAIARVVARAALAMGAARVRSSIRQRRTILGRFISRRECGFAARVLRKLQPDLVFVDTLFFAPLLPHLSGKSHAVLIAHDVFHRRVDSLRRRGFLVEPPLDRATEAGLLSRFDVVVAISDEEKAIFQEMVPSLAVLTLAYSVTPVREPACHRRERRCVFVGSRAPHNVDGLEWLLREVWPMVVARVPEAELHVYGTVCEGFGQTPPQVVLHGWASDLAAVYRASSVGLAPLQAGSGLKIKLVEYLAHGLACVATPVGAQGFEASPDLPFLVAEGPEDFAAAICRVLLEGRLRAALSESAYRYCERACSADVFRPLAVHLRASQDRPAS